jgi:WhiB family redox-sensing transcriptional regulator
MSTGLERLLAARPWMDEALCAQIDTELFFPEKGGSTKEAKRACSLCPVREQCLAQALADREAHGIWGGLSERERRKLVKAEDIPAPSRERVLSTDRLRALHAAGMTDGQIAREVDCNTATVQRARSRMGLPVNTAPHRPERAA